MLFAAWETETRGGPEIRFEIVRKIFQTEKRVPGSIVPFSYTTGKKPAAYTYVRGLFLFLFKNCPLFSNTS